MTASKKPRERAVTTRNRAAGKGPRMILFGDSHSHAVQRALEKRQGKGRPLPLAAHRLLKEKGTSQIGDTAFEDFLKMIASLGPDDIVFSAIGGNQHAVFSTIQHPRKFDFIAPGEPFRPESGAEIIPFRVLSDMFGNGLRNGDGKSLKAIRDATPARVVHIIPPPPKADNEFIQQHHETLFASEGIGTRGVSSPSLRLKFWKLQTKILAEICAELGIEVMMPPPATLDEQGFLARKFWGKDATHANPSYGEMLLRQIEQQALPEQAAA